MITRKQVVYVVLYGVFFAALLAALVLPKPYCSYAQSLWVIWFAVMGGYGASLESKKSKVELLEKVVVVAVIIGAVGMLFYGEPTYDEDGYPVSEGREITFEQKAAASVRLFSKIFLGGALGIQAAFVLRPKARKQDEDPQGGGRC